MLFAQNTLLHTCTYTSTRATCPAAKENFASALQHVS